MNEDFEKSADEAAAFQRICLETMSKMMQAAFTFTPNSPPPEVLRQIRSGIFQALAESWEQFMRSPQFLAGMKQWMENAIAARKLTNDFMGRMRNEMQAPSRADVDTIMLTVRHLEQRLLDRIDDLSQKVTGLSEQMIQQSRPRPRRAAPKAKSAIEPNVRNGRPTKP